MDKRLDPGRICRSVGVVGRGPAACNRRDLVSSPVNFVVGTRCCSLGTAMILSLMPFQSSPVSYDLHFLHLLFFRLNRVLWLYKKYQGACGADGCSAIITTRARPPAYSWSFVSCCPGFFSPTRITVFVVNASREPLSFDGEAVAQRVAAFNRRDRLARPPGETWRTGSQAGQLSSDCLHLQPPCGT